MHRCLYALGCDNDQVTAAGWAAVAAFFAAFCSVVNVAVSVRLMRKSELEKWRRDVERQLILQVLSLSGRVGDYSTLAHPGGRDSDEIELRRRELHEATEAIYSATLELQLVADRHVVEAVHELAKSFESLRQWLRAGGGPDNKYELYCTVNNHVAKQRAAVVSATRLDLGLRRIELPEPL